MARVPLTELIFSGTAPIRPAARKSVEVLKRGTTNKATLYTAEVGGATVAQPIVTDSIGHPVAPGGTTVWVDAGAYDISVAGTITQWEATTSTAGSLEPALEKSPINVKYPAYGAVGNGVTDDSAAIQAALTVAKNDGGGIVFIPAGTYIVNTTLVIGDNVTLCGAGPHASIIKVGIGKKIGVLKSERFEEGGANSGASYVNLLNIGFDANAANNVGSTAALVALDGKCPKAVNIFCKGGYINFYSVMKRPELEGGNIPEHGYFKTLDLAESTGFGFFIEGPHDSRLMGAEIRTLSGIGAYIHGTAMNCESVHVYGKSTYGFHAGGGHNFVNCTSEGNTVGAVGFFGDSNHWTGGWLFAAGAEDAKVGFIFGDGTHTANATQIEAVRMEGFINGAFIFERTAEGSKISAWVFATSGEAVHGAPSRRVWFDVVLRGGQTWGTAATAVQELAAANIITLNEFRTGAYNVYKISGGTEVKKITILPKDTVVVLRIADTTKIVDGENLHLAGNSEGAAQRTLTLISDGVEWWEIGRAGT